MTKTKVAPFYLGHGVQRQRSSITYHNCSPVFPLADSPTYNKWLQQLMQRHESTLSSTWPPQPILWGPGRPRWCFPVAFHQAFYRPLNAFLDDKYSHISTRYITKSKLFQPNGSTSVMLTQNTVHRKQFPYTQTPTQANSLLLACHHHLDWFSTNQIFTIKINLPIKNVYPFL